MSSANVIIANQLDRKYHEGGNGCGNISSNQPNTTEYLNTTPIALAEQIENGLDVIHYGGQFWYNKNGCYRPAEMELRNYLQGKLGNEFSQHKVNQVFYTLLSRVRVEKLDTPSDWINFKNGVYNFREGRFYSHKEKKDIKFMNQIPVDYNEEAKCPRIEQFLSEVVSPEDRRTLLQFLGYCLVPTTRFEKALMLIGDGANGKSTFIKLMTAMIGQENISNLSLVDLSKQFRLSGIVGKMVNIYPDLPYKNVADLSVFKAVVSGDPITGEKKFGNSFTFVPYAKMVFSTNKLPTTQDISPAFFRRWLIVEFPNSFNGKQRDTGLLDKLITNEALQGLAQSAIECLIELYENEAFSESSKMQELLGSYERANNSVAAFIKERCETGESLEIHKTALYKSYKNFAHDEGLQMLGRNDFNKELRKQLPSLMEVSDSSRRWRGITVDK